MFHYSLYSDSPVVRENLDRMSEKIIQAIWHHLFLKMEELAATDGTPIKILDRGVWNNDAGPDFKEAKIKIGENVMTGDVEVHWKTSDWKHHRHTENSSYDKVILHVVFIDDDEEKRIPTLEIRNYLSDNLINIVKKIHAIQEDQKNIFCYDTAPRLEPGFMDRWVLENGRERLEEKCRKFETQMIQQGADFDQILYQGMMDALGFSKNREPFQKLSNKITYRMLMDSIAHDEEATALMRLQAILFGAGGFLTEVKSLQVVPFVQRLENLWAEFQSKHGTVPMRCNEWKLFRMRPDNFPTIRIAGFSMFLVQHRQEELLPFFMSRINCTTTASFDDCASPLTVRAFGHWSEHYLLEDGGRRQFGDLIGRQRAFEIMVNAVLPVAALYARKKGLEGVHQNILHLYQTAASFEENSIVNYMKKQIKKAAKGKRSIQYVQGLIQLYKRCTEYNCADCPVFEKSMEGKN